MAACTTIILAHDNIRSAFAAARRQTLIYLLTLMLQLLTMAEQRLSNQPQSFCYTKSINKHVACRVTKKVTRWHATLITTSTEFLMQSFACKVACNWVHLWANACWENKIHKNNKTTKAEYDWFSSSNQHLVAYVALSVERRNRNFIN